MYTVGEIRTAIRTNNRKKAYEMLQVALKEKPTADTWYLAAKLVTDRDTKIQYLRTALLHDRDHRKSLDLLRELGTDITGEHPILVHSFMHELQLQANKSPLLKHFPPAIQAIIGLAIVGVIVVAMGMLFTRLMPASGPALGDGPSVNVVEFISTTQVETSFTASSLDILFSQQRRDSAIGKDILQFDIRGAGDQLRTVEVFVYDSVQAILDDQSTLAIYDQAANSIAHANIIAVYPIDISEANAMTIANIVDQLANGGTQ